MDNQKKLVDLKKISSIIKLASKNNVKRIVVEGVEVEFHDSTNQAPKSSMANRQYGYGSKKDRKSDALNPDHQSQEINEAERDLQLAQLEIENPLEYERIMSLPDGEKEFLNAGILDNRVE